MRWLVALAALGAACGKGGGKSGESCAMVADRAVALMATHLDQAVTQAFLAETEQ
jgi:hypothetical protein